jgi:WD40 repeat protein
MRIRSSRRNLRPTAAPFSSSLDGTTRLWDVATGQEIVRFAGGRLAALPPDNRRALIIDVDRTVHLLDLSGGSKRPLENVSGAIQIAFAPDGQSYVVGVGGGAQLFNAATDAPGRLLAHNGLSALVYAPDGRWLLTGAQDGLARLWAASDGREARRFGGHGGRGGRGCI